MEKEAQQDVGPEVRPTVPDYVPVRMLNEYVYCPRLFYLEWVSKQFADNEFTVDGRWQHRAVDVEAGAAPAGDDEELFRNARAVTLSSDALGLIGKADIIEGHGTKVIPVDIKRGRPSKHGDHPVHLPERVQLAALGLLLRENGYECSEAAVFFVETRQRIGFDLDDDLIETTLRQLELARLAAASPEAPAPLDDSPKCDGCSLVGICLPDEIGFTTGQRTAPPRRLIPTDDSARPLYVTVPGSYVRKSGGRIEITKDREVIASERLIDVSQLALYGNIQVSSQAVRELMKNDIPVCWFTWGGWFQGITEGLPANNVELRRRQVLSSPDQSLRISGAMIAGKIRNSRTLLRRNSRDRNKETLASLRMLAKRAEHAESVQSLLGYEGTAARLYFSQFPTMLRSADSLPGGPFDMTGRNRRPPRDAVNCLLSFVYGLLTKDCVATLRSVGFDPLSGFLHTPRFGRPALALDLSEEFRSVVADSVVLTVINNREVAPKDFIVRAGGVALTPDGRKSVLRAYERRLGDQLTHPVFGYKITWRRTIEVQARMLAAHLMGEIDAYRPIETR